MTVFDSNFQIQSKELLSNTTLSPQTTSILVQMAHWNTIGMETMIQIIRTLPINREITQWLISTDSIGQNPPNGSLQSPSSSFLSTSVSPQEHTDPEMLIWKSFSTLTKRISHGYTSLQHHGTLEPRSSHCYSFHWPKVPVVCQDTSAPTSSLSYSCYHAHWHRTSLPWLCADYLVEELLP